MILILSFATSVWAVQEVRDVMIHGHENAHKLSVISPFQSIDEAKPLPCVSEKEGFRCQEIASSGSLFEAGLQNGDLIVSVDGDKDLRSEELKEILDKIGRRKYQELVVVRQGERKILKKTSPH